MISTCTCSDKPGSTIVLIHHCYLSCYAVTLSQGIVLLDYIYRRSCILSSSSYSIKGSWGCLVAKTAQHWTSVHNNCTDSLILLLLLPQIQTKADVQERICVCVLLLHYCSLYLISTICTTWEKYPNYALFIFSKDTMGIRGEMEEKGPSTSGVFYHAVHVYQWIFTVTIVLNSCTCICKEQKFNLWTHFTVNS